jgi:hypothetical protein
MMRDVDLAARDFGVATMSRRTKGVLILAAMLLMLALLCVQRPARGQNAQEATPTPTPPVHQYVIACAVDELPVEVRKANAAGFSINVSSECLAVEAKVVCISSEEDYEE